jgi:hypothetical protein
MKHAVATHNKRRRLVVASQDVSSLSLLLPIALSPSFPTLLPVVLSPLTSLLSSTIAIAIVACRHSRRCPSPSSSSSYPIAPSSVAPSSTSPVATVEIVAIIVNFDASRAVAILVVVVVFVGHRQSFFSEFNT